MPNIDQKWYGEMTETKWGVFNMIFLAIIVWLLCGYMAVKTWQSIATDMGAKMFNDQFDGVFLFDVFFIFVVIIGGPISWGISQLFKESK